MTSPNNNPETTVLMSSELLGTCVPTTLNNNENKDKLTTYAVLKGNVGSFRKSLVSILSFPSNSSFTFYLALTKKEVLIGKLRH